jgi:hypothetical protein
MESELTGSIACCAVALTVRCKFNDPPAYELRTLIDESTASLHRCVLCHAAGAEDKEEAK